MCVLSQEDVIHARRDTFIRLCGQFLVELVVCAEKVLVLTAAEVACVRMPGYGKNGWTSFLRGPGIGLNSSYGPRIEKIDVGLARSFSIKEGREPQFEASPPRVLQFSARFTF
jgi:hypothetical protein